MITFDEKSLIEDGKRFFPVMGEMHYSRTERKHWARSLERMKAGGVDIVSSYVIWIHHEEIEGEYDFSGNKDLRAFTETVKRSGMRMFLRIGPWVHAEVRNGGFPDWIYKKGFEPRTNDERYFKEVERLYRKIYGEVEGLFYPDGPIIGVQIENEYGHCGGLTGEDGERHMKRLTEIARKIGYKPQLFTATGWGGAVTGGLLPVMGAYCDAPWDTLIEKLPASPNYLISHERNDKNIGSDLGLGYGLTFNACKFPYLMAELGGGLQPTGHRRVVASAKDTGAMTLCKLAGGCNLLGYYMYHAGTNPRGKLTSLEESRESGSLNDMPKLNYDGRTPIREYGQYGEVFKELKLFTSFTREFGEFLCESETLVAADNAVHADDFKSVRYSTRTVGNSGFLFVNNYVRGYEMPEKKLEKIELNKKEFKTDLRIAKGQYGIYPINMPLYGGANLRFANATPLFCLNGKDYVFYTADGERANYEFDSEPKGKLITLSRSEAKNADKVAFDKDYLMITSGYVAKSGKSVLITTAGDASVRCYPKLKSVPNGWSEQIDGDFGVYEKKCEGIEPIVETKYKGMFCGKAVYELAIDYSGVTAEEILFDVFYEGNRAEIYADGKMLNDDFYGGDNGRLRLCLSFDERQRLLPVLRQERSIRRFDA